MTGSVGKTQKSVFNEENKLKRIISFSLRHYAVIHTVNQLKNPEIWELTFVRTFMFMEDSYLVI